MADSTLSVVRTKQWADRYRRYRIIVDGTEVGRVAAGEQLRVNVPEGKRLVIAKIDWCRSNQLELTVLPDKEITLAVSANAKGLLLLAAIYFVTLGYWQYLYLEET